MIGSAVFPVAFSISWSKCSATAAISGALIGAFLGISSWLIYGAASGGVTVANLGRDEIMLTGNLVAILSSGAICIIISLLRPDDCDWTSTRSIPLIEDDPNAEVAQETEEELARAMKMISIWGFGLTGILVIVWPLLSLPFRVFSKGYFTLWVRYFALAMGNIGGDYLILTDILFFHREGGDRVHLGYYGYCSYGYPSSIRRSQCTFARVLRKARRA